MDQYEIHSARENYKSKFRPELKDLDLVKLKSFMGLLFYTTTFNQIMKI